MMNCHANLRRWLDQFPDEELLQRVDTGTSCAHTCQEVSPLSLLTLYI